MAVDPGGIYGGLKRRKKPPKPSFRSTPRDLMRRWADKYRMKPGRRTRPSGGGGGGSRRPRPPGGGGGGKKKKPEKKPPTWWGEEWFGEGREVDVKGLGVTNLRDMRHFQNIDPLWREWLQGLVKQAGAQGWWQNQQQSPLQWMAPVWSAM